MSRSLKLLASASPANSGKAVRVFYLVSGPCATFEVMEPFGLYQMLQLFVILVAVVFCTMAAVSTGLYLLELVSDLLLRLTDWIGNKLRKDE